MVRSAYGGGCNDRSHLKVAGLSVISIDSVISFFSCSLVPLDVGSLMSYTSDFPQSLRADSVSEFKIDQIVV